MQQRWRLPFGIVDLVPSITTSLPMQHEPGMIHFHMIVFICNHFGGVLRFEFKATATSGVEDPQDMIAYRKLWIGPSVSNIYLGMPLVVTEY